MSLFTKRESYKVEVVDGKRVLVPKDEATRKIVLKRMQREQTRKKSRPRLDAQVRLYKQRERAEKLKARDVRRKKWKRITAVSRETMYPYKRPSKKKKTSAPNYVVIKGKAYPVARPPKKKKKKPDFSWSSVSKEMNDVFKGF